MANLSDDLRITNKAALLYKLETRVNPVAGHIVDLAMTVIDLIYIVQKQSSRSYILLIKANVDYIIIK